MQFNFQQIINALNQGLPLSDNFAFRIARASVVPADYLFNTFLPQQLRPDYHINGGSMRIFPTMLGQVPMDSPYPPMGAISAEQFFENTTKLGGQMFFPEKEQRDMQAWEKSIIANAFLDGTTNETIINDINSRRMEAVTGFADMLVKAHWDTYEWLRGRALATGAIDWTFGDIPLKVDYNVPTANKLTSRSGNDAYDGSTSKFWTDIRQLYKKLANGYTLIMNSNTWTSIIDNSVNNIRVVVNFGQTREFVRFVGTIESNSTDVRDRVRTVIYDKSGTIIDAKTGALTAVPFLQDGEIIAIGDQNPDGYELTLGSVPDPNLNLTLGYTHIAPTIEGQGRPGIWSRIYTPEGKPMQLIGETAANMLPVITNPRKLVIMKTTVS